MGRSGYRTQKRPDPSSRANLWIIPSRLAALENYCGQTHGHRAGADTEPEWTESEYADAPSVDPANITFVAKVKPSGQTLVIKFAERYAAEAYGLLAGEGTTRRLLYCGLLAGENDVRKDGAVVARAASGLVACGLVRHARSLWNIR